MKPAALHERIRAEIETAILSGALAPGERIPSEQVLMTEYGCARMTVNKALSALATAGLLERRKRAGSFVARPRAQSMELAIPDLREEISARGQVYGWRMESRRVLDAATDARAAQLGAEGQLLEICGLHFADGVPFAWEERLVSLSAVPEIADLDFTIDPPGSWLLHHIPWTEGENRIGAIKAPVDAAALLGVEPGEACLLLTRRTWRGDEGITLVRQLFLAGHYELVARFGSQI